MTSKGNFVFDTNTLLSAAIRPLSVPAQAFEKALLQGEVVYSAETLAEMKTVFARPKFDRYITIAERQKFVHDFLNAAILVIAPSLTAPTCRDPKDDKFLALAIASNAKIIVTGDDDLLVLHPFQGITILKPAEFLAVVL